MADATMRAIIAIVVSLALTGLWAFLWVGPPPTL